MDNCCCGFGHRDLLVDMKNELIAVINELIISENINIFLTGGMGDFDAQFSAAVRSCKVQNENVKLILIKPYFSNELNINKKYYEENYDDILIPIELAGCYYKSAITKRNRWMAEQSQIVLSGVSRDFGGAYDTIKYAEKAGKRIIEIRKNLKIKSL